jgi:DNA-binding IclR family transcriptional regulator
MVDAEVPDHGPRSNRDRSGSTWNRTGDTVASTMDSERDTSGLELIAKVNAVLTVLERQGETVAADIADKIGEPLSSIYRLLQSLTAIGWVDRGPRRGTYRLGLLLMTIGGQIDESLDIRDCALPSLRSLVDEIGVTSFLCVPRGARAVCVERIEGYAVRSLAMQLGSSLPLYAGAAPRAILAFLPESEQRGVLRQTDRQPGDPPRPDADAVRDDVDQVRQQGYSVSDGDVTPGIAALGAPVFNHRGELAGAISISGLRAQVLGVVKQQNIDLVIARARDVSEALGYTAARLDEH